MMMCNMYVRHILEEQVNISMSLTCGFYRCHQLLSKNSRGKKKKWTLLIMPQLVRENSCFETVMFGLLISTSVMIVHSFQAHRESVPRTRTVCYPVARRKSACDPEKSLLNPRVCLSCHTPRWGDSVAQLDSWVLWTTILYEQATAAQIVCAVLPCGST